MTGIAGTVPLYGKFFGASSAWHEGNGTRLRAPGFQEGTFRASFEDVVLRISIRTFFIEEGIFVASYTVDVRVQGVTEDDLIELEDGLCLLLGIEIGASEVTVLVDVSLDEPVGRGIGLGGLGLRFRDPSEGGHLGISGVLPRQSAYQETSPCDHHGPTQNERP